MFDEMIKMGPKEEKEKEKGKREGVLGERSCKGEELKEHGFLVGKRVLVNWYRFV